MINKNNIKIAIRVDANNTMGIGHVMRCFAVAERLKKQGCEIFFLYNEIPESLLTKIRSKGFKVKHLPSAKSDIFNMVQSLLDISANYLIIDGYHLNDDYVVEAKKIGVMTIRLDDILQDESSSADIIINPSNSAEYNDYKKWAPKAKLLLGSRYFAFREEIIDNYVPKKKSNGENPRSIMINFGGSDPLDLSYRVALSLSKALPYVRINIITGAAYKNPSRFKSLSQENINHYHDISNMSELMASADLAISAGGGTIAELELYKVPTLLVITAENQMKAAHKTWCHVIQNSPKEEKLIENITQSSLEIWNDKSAQNKIISNITDGLDCLGSARIVTEILNLGPSNA